MLWTSRRVHVHQISLRSSSPHPRPVSKKPTGSAYHAYRASVLLTGCSKVYVECSALQLVCSVQPARLNYGHARPLKIAFLLARMGARGLCRLLQRLSGRRHEVPQPWAALSSMKLDRCNFVMSPSPAGCQQLSWAARTTPEPAQEAPCCRRRAISTAQLDQLKSPAIAANQSRHRRPQLEWKVLPAELSLAVCRGDLLPS